MAENEPMDVESVPPFKTIRILKLIKDAQQKHGLRHGNYKRYADYCGRRMQRLRKTLKFTHNHKCVSKKSAKFVYKAVTNDAINDPRFIELLIYTVEKCWARGMEYKVGSEEEADTRQKHHARTRLLKALKHVKSLDGISGNLSQVDSMTKLEFKAYNAFISGSFYLEKQAWQQALNNYKLSKIIYEKMQQIDRSSEYITYYEQRCRELANLIKVCEYNCGDVATLATEDLLKLSLSENGEELNIDQLVQEAKTTIDAESESHKESDYQRLKLAIENHLRLAANLGAGGKRAKPRAYLRLYAKVIQCCDEILALPSVSTDAELKAAYEFRAEFYRAVKCYRMAGAYAAIGRTVEALRLYEHALWRNTNCASLWQALNAAKASVSETDNDMQQLTADINKTKRAAEKMRDDQEKEATRREEEKKRQAAEQKRQQEEKARKEAARAAMPPPRVSAKPVDTQPHKEAKETTQEVSDEECEDEYETASSSEDEEPEQKQGSGFMGGIKKILWG